MKIFGGFRLTTLVRHNLTHFWQINLAVVSGVAVAVAVLAGSLVVGSSVRASLHDLALERLAKVDLVITSTHFVRESLADDLARSDDIYEVFDAVTPIISIEGFVTHQDSGRRAFGIQVYGVDERFWRFHGREPEAFSQNAVLVSDGLARELGARVGDALLVRMEKPAVVPVTSLFGRRNDVGRTLRLSIENVLMPDELGEFSFRPQQGQARSVFVSLPRLQRELEQADRVNTILLRTGHAELSATGREDASRLSRVETAVQTVATLEDLGLRVRKLPEQVSFTVESEAGLLNHETVAVIADTARMQGLHIEPILTYLANRFSLEGRLLPYSLITALDLRLITGVEIGSGLSRSDAIVLNDWAADDLGAQPGDSITIEYYVWEDEGRLTTREVDLKVAAVVPIAGPARDRNLAPHYPGITDANDVIDWDPSFEVDLSLIRPKDEDYWDEYRLTPKAFVSLEVGQQLWASRWGQLTSVRFYPQVDELDLARERFEVSLRTALDPLALGFVVYPARALALEASAGATDFSLYFIYFSFFLVVSALLLASLFFRLGIEQRLREIGLLRAMGLSPTLIRRVFWSEALVLSVIGSAVGVAGAMGYAEVIMFGLRTWWVDAVGTTRLALHVSRLALAGGFAGGIAVSLVSIVWTLRALDPASARSLISGVVTEATGLSEPEKGGFRPRQLRVVILAVGLSVVGLALVVAASIGLLGATASFFGAGLSLLCAMLAFSWAWLQTWPRHHTGSLRSVIQIGFRNTTARPGRSVLCIALIASAAFIIVAVDAFHRESNDADLGPQSGTGGFTLLAESLLPIVHDPSTKDGLDVLDLIDLYEAGGQLSGVSLARFRLRPGEDASCLNLYQAKDPRILAPTPDFVELDRFTFGATLAETEIEEQNPWKLLDRKFKDGAIPAIADSTSLAYALHLSVGEDFLINRDTSRPIRLRIVAELSDSIFQRELLIAESHFERLFPADDGYRFFLVDAPSDRTESVATALEDRLGEFGFDVVSAVERLDTFHRVENAYLATFQTLGGLGLIFGTLGLGAVLLRNVFERRREFALLKAVGYNVGQLSLIVLAENVLLLLSGLVIGAVCAVVAIAPAWQERGGGWPILSLGALLMVVLITGVTVSLVATAMVFRSQLLLGLRTE